MWCVSQDSTVVHMIIVILPSYLQPTSLQNPQCQSHPAVGDKAEGFMGGVSQVAKDFKHQHCLLTADQQVLFMFHVFSHLFPLNHHQQKLCQIQKQPIFLFYFTNC